MIRQLTLASAMAAITLTSAAAATCEKNFKAEGIPLVTNMSYKTWQEFSKLKPEVALKRMAQGVAAEGFSGIKVNKELGSIDAYQDTAGSGRLQTLRIVARKRGNGTRVDAVFSIQVGQVTTKEVVRKGLCGIIASAAQ